MKPLKPIIDTLPLSLASRDAETEHERKLCLDLAFSIVQGSPRPKQLYDSGEGRNCLSDRAFQALGAVLRSAEAHWAEMKAKRKLSFSDDNSDDKSDDEEVKQMRSGKKGHKLKKSKSSRDVENGKGKGTGKGKEKVLPEVVSSVDEGVFQHR